MEAAQLRRGRSTSVGFGYVGLTDGVNPTPLSNC